MGKGFLERRRQREDEAKDRGRDNAWRSIIKKEGRMRNKAGRHNKK